ncbi:triosephosphate isomerase [Alloalcanivorax xenomutans]|uniref:triose-phosphate isomerase n=1 Tax=Alloalcanivorax xenomutans TaxID=1094342 RepID=UPI000BC9CABF|nr:triose-phosphate isomerase [Alloalcanivorax xenomutans]MCE7525337.1 triose-phosphate isomerase [Alloalcanivorax xenomutans]SOC19926.1 triosephosphate isomerase [Alloalcanivorax xenomutans]
MTRTPLVAGNWKMNGRLDMVEALGASLGGLRNSRAEVAVCPPFPYLAALARALGGSGVQIGAQNVSSHEDGAFTGEVSAEMLADMGCRYVIVGHSERRALYGEDDELVGEKFLRAQQGGLIPILCVGETLREREAGETEQVVVRQVSSVLDVAGIGAFDQAVVAYEPVWAIGTGETATPEQAQEVHARLRSALAAEDASVASRIRLLYGGSVKSDNAALLFAQPDIDGGLIGGASLSADEFSAICLAAE